MRRLSLALLLLGALTGCRETLTGSEDEEPIDLSPRIVGAWAGAYDGRLGLLGTDDALRDTFRVELDVFRVGADFAYTGRVLRGGTNLTPLYDCSPDSLSVSNDRRATFRCVQGTQLGDTLLFRMETQADPEFQTLHGTVRDVLRDEDATYPIELTRTDS